MQIDYLASTPHDLLNQVLAAVTVYASIQPVGKAGSVSALECHRQQPKTWNPLSIICVMLMT